MNNLNYRQMNGLSLAYIGDAIYELEVRRHFLSLGLTKVNELQKRSKHYVSAKAHAALFEQMMLSHIQKQKILMSLRIEFQQVLKHYLVICICLNNMSAS